MFRVGIGFLIVFGAVGGMEDPTAPLALLVGIAVLGLTLMYYGVKAIKE
jgi:hypothetical protein